MPGTREDVLDEVLAFVKRGYELWNDRQVARVRTYLDEGRAMAAAREASTSG